MVRYSGLLQHVGTWRGGMLVEKDLETKRQTAKARIRGEVDSLTIGSTTLRRPACTEGLFPFLEAGREATLYVYRHMFSKNYIIGVKYADGNKHLMPGDEVRGTILQYLFVWPLLLAIPGMLIGVVLGKILGTGGDVLPPLCMLGTTLFAWWSAYRLRQDLKLARAD